MKEFHDKNKIIKALENFEKDMQLKPQVYKKQKKQIISVIQKVENITENKRNKLKTTLALILLFLVMTSPLYSTTAANFIEKIVPIKFSNDNQSRLDANIIKIVKQSGYNYDSVSLSTNPFTVEIVLLSSNTSLHQKKTVLMPKIKELLKKESINDYNINIKEYQKSKDNNEDVEKIEINVEPNQNTQWPKIVSNIYQSLGGKKTYQVKGISYKTKENITYVYINTEMKNNQESTLKVKAIEKALKTYLSQDSTKEMIKSEKYEIRIYDKKKIIKAIKN